MFINILFYFLFFFIGVYKYTFTAGCMISGVPEKCLMETTIFVGNWIIV
jgi:hypothetical protein